MRFRRQLYNHYSPILFIINFNDFTLIFNTFRKFLNFSPKVQYYSSLVCRYSISIHRFHSPRRKNPMSRKGEMLRYSSLMISESANFGLVEKRLMSLQFGWQRCWIACVCTRIFQIPMISPPFIPLTKKMWKIEFFT